MAGRAALVTGGGGGIGEAPGRLFAEEGAAVALVDADKPAVEAAATAIAREVAGALVLAGAADLAREAEAGRAVEAAVARLGALHTLVNVAGVRVYAALVDAVPADWEHIIGVNVLATAYCCRAGLPALRASGRGTIVNVSSVYGVMGRAGMGQYDTTKAAVLGYTRALSTGWSQMRTWMPSDSSSDWKASISRATTSAARPVRAYPRPSCAHSAPTPISWGGGRSRARWPTPSCFWPGTSRPS